MEVVDIDLDNIPLNESTMPSSTIDSTSSLGGGIELLMNEKKKSSSSSTKIDLEDLDLLENELNDLSETNTSVPSDGQSKFINGIGGLGSFGNMFGLGNKSNENNNSSTGNNINLGQATKDTSASNARTWDGFTKVGEDIPKETRSSVHLSEREKRRKKRLMIKKLEEWAEKGTYKHGSSFTMESNFDEIEDEYEGALEEKRKKDSIKLQGWWFTTVINTLEYGNALLNPFDLNLDGWGEQVSEDLDSYDEIFSELHDKYKGGKMAPEVSLLLRIGFSAAVVNMSNKMLSSATPGFNDVIKQSPELMKMFSNAAVDTMSKQNSAFDFAKSMMNPPEEVNTKLGPPPAPVETKSQAPPKRPGSMNFTAHPGNRPDITMAQATPMFREGGIDITSNSRNINEPDAPLPLKRPDMRGPQTTPDIDQLLSGLKPKINDSVPVSSPIENDSKKLGSESIVSVSSLRDLESSQMPKKGRRKNTSNRNNTVALDI